LRRLEYWFWPSCIEVNGVKSRPVPILIARCVDVVILALCGCALLRAQNSAARRNTQPINDGLRVALPGNVHPLAHPAYDKGAVPDSFATQRMLLLLQRSAQQELALREFIASTQTPGGANYHQWLTPEQFGSDYGPADSDIAAVTAWLQSHGFSVARITKGNTAIEFSGTAGQIRATFGTEIHTYLVHGGSASRQQ
jgi:Pro-kumamolisin, activation domain